MVDHRRWRRWRWGRGHMTLFYALHWPDDYSILTLFPLTRPSRFHGSHLASRPHSCPRFLRPLSHPQMRTFGRVRTMIFFMTISKFSKHYINKITIFPRLPWYLLQAPQPSSSTTRTRRAPEHFEGGETVKASKKSNNTTAPASKSFEKTLFSNWKSIIDV